MFQKLSPSNLSLTSAQTFQLITNRYLAIHEGRASTDALKQLNSACQKLVADGYADEYTAQMVVLSERLTEKTMHSFAVALKGAAQLFSDDENILFFLLKNSERIDALNGKGFSEKLLLSMYPGGLDTLLHYLQCRFSERGFSRLLPTITHKLSILDPSLLCRLSKNNTQS